MSTHLETLRLQARALPEAPGVYFWRDEKRKTLYIGKAINLRARVASYFPRSRKDRRTRDLLTRARSIDCEVTSTELEALFRESALIKQVQPVFNRALRNSHRMYYLKLDGALQDPYLEIVREVDDDGSLYFGPFRSGQVARETVRFVHDVLPLRKCTAVKPRCRPCLYYQMHKCAAPLLDEEHRRAHQETIGRMHEILDGRIDRVLAWLEGKRDRMSESLLFERAAEMQQRIDLLQDSARRQTVLDAAVQCRCVLISCLNEEQRPSLLLVAHGRVVSVREMIQCAPPEVARWIQAHDPVVRAIQKQQSDVDASMVLERWLTRNRAHATWVAIPRECPEEDLLDRVAYVLGQTARVPVPV